MVAARHRPVSGQLMGEGPPTGYQGGGVEPGRRPVRQRPGGVPLAQSAHKASRACPVTVRDWEFTDPRQVTHFHILKFNHRLIKYLTHA